MSKVKMNIVKSFGKIKYRPETIGLSPINKTGKDVKICIIDSGLPDHSAINGCVDYINFSSSITSEDLKGNATIIAGLMTSNNDEKIIGFIPDAKLYFAKTNDNIDFSGIIASVLWGITKGVDIIVIPSPINDYNEILSDVIKKANENNICVVLMSAKDVKYSDALTVVPSNIDGVVYSGSGKISITAKDLISTYLNQSYVKVSGGLGVSSIIASMCALLIENNKDNDIRYNPSIIYGQLIQMTINKENS